MNSLAANRSPIESPFTSQAPDEALVRFARDLAPSGDDLNGHDRRADPRYPLCLNILAIPIDENSNSAGEPLLGVSRNISTSGIAMLFTRPVADGRLALQFGDPRGGHVRLIMNVLRCRPLANFFEVAGTFVPKL